MVQGRRWGAVPARVSARLAPKAAVLRVGEDGIDFSVRGPDRVVDVLFDERRIWSFWLLRDTTGVVGFHRRAPWPDRMRPFLDGTTRLTIREHVSEFVHFEEERQFGTASRPIAFLNKAGLEISLDKSGRFSPTFSVRTEKDLAPLLDAMETIGSILAEHDITVFPAWGTLLGAVREKTFLGHDSDADLSYVSRWQTPVDVARESFALQRILKEKGFETYRYSGAAFRIDVVEGDGVKRGLDLFAAFYDSGRLYVMGEVGADYREEWLWPYTTCELAGREFPSPAQPERMLEAMYGPGWRVPDPAFKFATPREVSDRLNGWFRGTAPGRQDWERTQLALGAKAPAVKPSSLARELHAAAPDAVVLDVGAGRGADALWLAQQGHKVIAYDYVPAALRGAARRAEREGWDLTVRPLNLTEWRATFAEGARVSREQGPRVILARHILDSTTHMGRESFGRFASMVLRGGGRLYAETWSGDGPGGFEVRPLRLAAVQRMVEGHSGAVVSTTTVLESDDPGCPGTVDRVIAEWK